MLKGQISTSALYPSPYQSLLQFQMPSYLVAESLGFAAEIVFPPMDVAAWSNLAFTFFGYSSSNTCNPYAVAMSLVGDLYPYSNTLILFYMAISSLGPWTQTTYGYSAAVQPGDLDDVISSYFVTKGITGQSSWNLWLLMNDTNVQFDGSMTLTWNDIGDPKTNVGDRLRVTCPARL